MEIKEILNMKPNIILIQSHINQEFTAGEVQKMLILEQVIRGDPNKLANAFVLKEEK